MLLIETGSWRDSVPCAAILSPCPRKVGRSDTLSVGSRTTLNTAFRGSRPRIVLKLGTWVQWVIRSRLTYCLHKSTVQFLPYLR